MFAEAPQRGFVARTLRRVASVLVVAGVVVAVVPGDLGRVVRLGAGR